MAEKSDKGNAGKGKKNKRNKANDATDAAANGDNAAAPGAAAFNPDPEQLVKIKKAMELLQLQEATSAAKTSDEAAKKTYEFWSTQPVPKLDENITSSEPIQEDIPLDKLRQDPYTLPSGFQWDTLNLDDPLVLKELYVLLNENYVEDDDNMFRFDYSPEFLRWALQPPGWLREWHCGVRTTKSNKLVGFISAIPASVRIYEKLQHLVEINFLCVHKKLRSKRLAPVLIKEITRRVNCKGIFQAVYTAGVVLPKPVGTCRYWHRSLNPKKLIEVKFSHLSRNMTMQRHVKLYRLPDTTKTEGLRQIKATDVPKACKLLNEFLKRYDLAPFYTEDEFSHWFMPKPNIIDCFVVEKPAEGSTNGGSPGDVNLTDMISFYTLPSTIMSHPTYNSLKAAYSFYNVSNATPWMDLMGDALVLAKKADFDVFNALDLMENTEFLEKLKFGIGDGNLQYYLYNWKCPSMEPKKIGLVLQ